MAYKKFSNTQPTSLSSGATNSDTTLYVVDGSSFPDPAAGGNGPYTILVGFGSSREEICTVTAKPGANILTVTRGEDGSSATSKNIGDVVVHGVSKRDWDDLLPKAGGTLTGAVTLSGAPTADLHAATKKYVDDTALLKAGGTMTGALTLSGAPTTGLHAATKTYVDARTLSGEVTYNGVEWQSVSFGVTYSQAPRVFCQPVDITGVIVYIRQRTTTGFEFAVHDPATGVNKNVACNVQWLAVPVA